jgi:hypothetical protein
MSSPPTPNSTHLNSRRNKVDALLKFCREFP